MGLMQGIWNIIKTIASAMWSIIKQVWDLLVAGTRAYPVAALVTFGILLLLVAMLAAGG